MVLDDGVAVAQVGRYPYRYCVSWFPIPVFRSTANSTIDAGIREWAAQDDSRLGTSVYGSCVPTLRGVVAMVL